MEKNNTWEGYNEMQLSELELLTTKYRKFLDNGKTERECINEIVKIIEAEGYQAIDELISKKTLLKKGDKVYGVWMKKAIVMFQIGERSMAEGMNILGAHIDSVRLDIKQNPLHESGGLAYFDTHYYGYIKKYQWVTIPLSLHGIVIKNDGSVIELNVGENEEEPVFFISDLLFHLGREQMDKKAANVIEGEALDIIVGSRPIKVKGEEKDKNADGKKENVKEAVKSGILDILKRRYNIDEEDFISAELEVVPAGKAREAGFDQSMILAYGQDDRVCAYTSMQAMLDTAETDKTTCCILVDKEEIGSAGATSMKSMFFENMVAEVMNLCGEYNELNVRRCLSRSCMLSSDVCGAFDPFYSNSFAERNTAYLGGGIVLNKYMGSMGKCGSNDANAEYLAHIRKIYAEGGVNFQTAEFGKVDAGGGSTIASILAQYGMNVIDCGVALLNMHAPWEAASKADVYETYRGYRVFIEKCSL